MPKKYHIMLDDEQRQALEARRASSLTLRQRNRIPSPLEESVLKPWQVRSWCLPKGISGEFIWRMEDVLSPYAEPYDPARPIVCFDEVSKELHAEAREPLPRAPGSPAKQDYEYVRRGRPTSPSSRWPACGA